jgi:hypothetical protein
MNDEQLRERWNRRAMAMNEEWYCNPPEDDNPETEDYDYEDMRSEYGDRKYHEMVDEGLIRRLTR